MCTLAISETISYFYSRQVGSDSGAPAARPQGKIPKYTIPDIQLDHVKQHIASFPTIEAHYSRERTQRFYVDQNLNQAIMYDLYKDQCAERGVQAVKIHKYRQILMRNSILAFKSPNQTGAIHVKNTKWMLKKVLK